MKLGNLGNFKCTSKSANLSSYTEAVLTIAFFDSLRKKHAVSIKPSFKHTMSLPVSAGDRIKGGK